jgi:ADP-ribose pyrophosphatase
MELWKKLKEVPYRAGYRKLIKRTFQLPGGQVADFDLNNGGSVVCVLAITSQTKVVLAKQFRPAQERILLELPGGSMEAGKQPEEAVKRELLEETGYAGNVQFVAKSLQSAYDTLVRYNFVATDCHKIQDPKHDPLEPIEVVEMSLEDFKQHLRSGEMTDVATGYLGLESLKLLQG